MARIQRRTAVDADTPRAARPDHPVVVGVPGSACEALG